ncbi:hypothetical protein [Salsuginibacillus kocurii]|uniref:hypothetical protein n=1 Tax=Salsuginibacillus kocurii TaxID=427078 RepID=UPI0012EA7547|nr:hypothetical protein [Salsuginibacillus kocurii]
MPELTRSNMVPLAKAGFHIAWHQITALLLIVGGTLILLSFLSLELTYESAAVLAVVLLSGNIVIFLLLTQKKYPQVFRSTLYPIINSLIIILLMLIGFFYK